jgi:F0F1-type ATP synthase assembly protein I
MRPGLIGAVLLGSAVACALSEIIVFQATSPPDVTAAVLGGLWIAMPYLVAVGLAVLFRRHAATLAVLLIALVIAAPTGVSLLHASAAQQEVSKEQVRNAVQPGEDPDHGPAAMRKAGAEMGAAFGWGFSILLAVILPPIQLVAVLIPTLLAYGIAALFRRQQKAEAGRMVTAGA